MLHSILMLLKFIGWILLVILGVILVLFLLILFCAVKYKARVNAAGTWKSIEGKLEFHWIFHLLRGTISYRQGKLCYEMKFAWKRILSSEEMQEHEEGLEKNDSVVSEISDPGKEEKVEEREAVCSPPEHRVVGETKEEPSEEVLETDEIEKSSPEVNIPLDKVSHSEADWQSESGQESSEQKKGLRKKLMEWGHRIKSRILHILHKIKYTIQGICGKINTLSEKKEQLKAFLTDEVHIAAFQRGVREIRRLLHFLNPRRLEMKLHFGFEDPYYTGKVLAAAAVLYPFTNEHVILEPDFEEKVLDGTVRIEGRVRAAHFVFILCNLILDKNARTTFRHIRKIMA